MQIKSVSIVMLAYNEAEIIEKVIREYYETIFVKLHDAEFIIAEDGSTDGTKEIIARLAEELDIKVVSGEKRKGYVQAYRDAIKLPTKDLVFFTDSSGKHYPEDFWSLYEYADHYDIVSGYKENRKDPLYRILMTRVFNWMVNLYFGTKFKDIDSGFKIFSRNAMLDILSDTWIMNALISFEIMVRLSYRGYKIREIPVRHRPRENGASRGLPLKKIPGVIVMALSNFHKIKKSAMECAGRNG